MKNRLNVIRINGFFGLFLITLLIGCMIEGIVIFPGKIFMHIWNFIAMHADNMPAMNLFHGIILWAIVALSTYAILKDKSPISYHSPNIISEEEIKKMLEQTKSMDKMPPIIKEENSEQEIKH